MNRVSLLAAISAGLLVSVLPSCGEAQETGPRKKLVGIVDAATKGMPLRAVRTEMPAIRKAVTKGLESSGLEAKAIISALVAKDDKSVPALAVCAILSPGVTREGIEKALVEDFKGSPWMVAGVLLHKCKTLSEATGMGLSLVKRKGRVAMVGHALLTRATLQKVNPIPGAWAPGATATLDPKQWSFLEKQKQLDYPWLLTRILEPVRANGGAAVGREVRQALLLIAQRGKHPDYRAFDGLEASKVGAWVSRCEAALTPRDVAEVVFPLRGFVESHLLASGRGR